MTVLRETISGLMKPPLIDATRRHYFVLDLMRGIAALIVLVWHYQHFLITRAGGDFAAGLRHSQPLYWLLWPFYEYGSFAVEFFWLVSGFVFASVYVSRKTTTREFAINRIARLYPLHLLTLVIVAALQLLSNAWLGHPLIYLHNDTYHFVLNVFMASNWFDAGTYSFNGPVWSVSIEILVYIIFWFTVPYIYRLGVLGPGLLAALFWIAGFGLHSGASTLMQCGFYFFLGALFYVSSQSLAQAWWLQVLPIVAAAGLGIGSAFFFPHHLLSVTTPLGLTAAMMAAVFVERPKIQRVARSMRWVGDNTYGTYLWHVPIQIMLLLGLDCIVGSRTVVYSPWFLLAFIAIVIVVARVSFITFEGPARTLLRRIGQRNKS